MGTNALGSDTLGSRNVAIGHAALTTQNFTSSSNSYNTAVGFQAGLAITDGQRNTFIGGLAGDANTTADNNTAVGYLSLSTNTTGSENTAVGRSALSTNESGDNNTAIGYGALTAGTTAANNTGIGTNALGSATTGGSNTAVGRDSAVSITTGSGNTIIGNYSGNGSGLDIRTSNNNIVLSDGDGNPKYASRTGIIVSTSAVQLAYTVGVGGAYVISAYNQSGGAQGVWFITARGSTVNVVSADNGTGLTVAFTATNYGTLNMATSSGTLVVTVTAMN